MAAAERTTILAWLAAAAVAIGALALVTLVERYTRDAIAANERARLAARLSSVLAPELRGLDLRIATVHVRDTPLAPERTADVYVALTAGEPRATVVASVAQGYNGPIALLVGLSRAGAVTGVRALAHDETRGLGGAIDANGGAWLRQFDGATTASPPLEAWAVKADDGAFDALSGATVTSRGVIAAVRDALLYFAQHRDELYAAALAAPADDAPRASEQP